MIACTIKKESDATELVSGFVGQRSVYSNSRVLPEYISRQRPGSGTTIDMALRTSIIDCELISHDAWSHGLSSIDNSDYVVPVYALLLLP